MSPKFQSVASLENIQARLKEIGFPDVQAFPDGAGGPRPEIRQMMAQFLGGDLLLVRHSPGETFVEVR
jgi:hypothetical protein